MNNKVPYLTRQIVYAFLVGLLVGGIFIGVMDSYAKKPLFSKAYDPESNYELEFNSPVEFDGNNNTNTPNTNSGANTNRPSTKPR